MYRQEPVARHVATNGLRVAQFEPALYADKALSQTIGGELPLRMGRRQVAKMLDDRRLTALEVSQAAT